MEMPISASRPHLTRAAINGIEPKIRITIGTLALDASYDVLRCHDVQKLTTWYLVNGNGADKERPCDAPPPSGLKTNEANTFAHFIWHTHQWLPLRKYNVPGNSANSVILDH